MRNTPPCKDCILFGRCVARYIKRRDAKFLPHHTIPEPINISAACIAITKIAKTCSLLFDFLKDELYIEPANDSQFHLFRSLKENFDYIKPLFEGEDDET